MNEHVGRFQCIVPGLAEVYSACGAHVSRSCVGPPNVEGNRWLHCVVCVGGGDVLVLLTIEGRLL